MNPRSIRFRLIVWYGGLLLAVVLLFGAYMYTRLQHYLTVVLTDSLNHRALQIAETLVPAIPEKGAAYFRSEIESRYAPALNDKFVRVTHDAQVIYLSGEPNDKTFDPHAIPRPTQMTRSTIREVQGNGGTDLLIAAVPAAARNSYYLVEVGASKQPSLRVLRDFLETLAVGLPILLILCVGGGYLLIGRALLPVKDLAAAARDITLHELSRRLPCISTGDELDVLATTLNSMIRRLDEAFQASGRFTTDASHELRTPLTIIRGELEALLSDRTLTPEMHEALGSLLEEAERLNKIVDGLLSLSRLDRGDGQSEQVRLDLGELAETTAEQMCLLAHEKKIELSCVREGTVLIDGDRSRLKQIIVNLLDNAIKYTPDQGRVTISTRTQNGHAILEVFDTGPGIPKEALPHVFERFFRADAVRSRSIDGAGIGLSIVYAICLAHGGSVSAANEPGGGCRVTAKFPLTGRG